MNLMQSKFPLSKTPLINKIQIPWKEYFSISYNENCILLVKSYEIDTEQLHKTCDEYSLNYFQVYTKYKNDKSNEIIASFDFSQSFGSFIERLKQIKEARELIPIAKTYRHQHINPTKEWEDVLPKDIQEWAWGRFRELSIDYDCVDNHRVANCKKSSQTRRYKRYQKGGCCGFFDTKELCPIDNNWYLLGFNFGH